jgi:hypothetical protein
MSNSPPVTAEVGTPLSDEALADPSMDGLTEEVKTVLELLAKVHEQTLALVQALSDTNERTYQPTLEFLRDMQSRVRGVPLKK